MSKIEVAERVVRELVANTAEGDRVGSVASICEATNLSIGAAIEVMQRFMALGLVVSTRGPHGGYWRTDIPLTQPGNDLAGELSVIAEDLARLAARLTAVADRIGRGPL